MAACKFTILARSFATSGIQNQMIKTPVAVYGISGRYAGAIYSAAIKAKELEKVESELLQFHGALNKNKKLYQVMRDPTIKKSIKAKTLQEVSDNMSFSKVTGNTLSLIAENGRIKDFNLIINSFKIIMSAHRGEITCEVISAKPLTDAERKDIEAALRKLAKEKKVLLTTKVDPQLIGGLIVSIGDRYADMSIASKIKKLSEVLRSVV